MSKLFRDSLVSNPGHRGFLLVLSSILLSACGSDSFKPASILAYEFPKNQKALTIRERTEARAMYFPEVLTEPQKIEQGRLIRMHGFLYIAYSKTPTEACPLIYRRTPTLALLLPDSGSLRFPFSSPRIRVDIPKEKGSKLGLLQGANVTIIGEFHRDETLLDVRDGLSISLRYVHVNPPREVYKKRDGMLRLN